ncbi:acylphosphatase [Hyphococcus sp.]|uniref:acylphosphatase n=1 Tax=Hyphococcus sp. TaxID=2038636 RepID=UPI003CCBA90C
MTNDANSTWKSVTAIISGRVQGVGFRDWTRREARQRGLSGWVRNCSNGDVEAVFCGPNEAVENMIAAARCGPATARVDDIGVSESDAPPRPGFEIKS